MTFSLTLPQSPSHNIYPFGTAFCFSLADMKFENMKCRYEIYLLVFNSTSQSFAGPSRELSSQTLEEKFHIYARPRIVRFVISYELHWLQILCCQFFLLFCYISPFKLLDILSKQFDMDICHICDCNWSGKFLIRLIQIGDSDIRLEMCNSHTLIQAFNLSTPLSDQHFDTHTSHKGDD